MIVDHIGSYYVKSIWREFFDLMMSCYKMELKGPITKLEIDSKHLPSETVMAEICRLTLEYLK